MVIIQLLQIINNNNKNFIKYQKSILLVKKSFTFSLSVSVRIINNNNKNQHKFKEILLSAYNQAMDL